MQTVQPSQPFKIYPGNLNTLNPTPVFAELYPTPYNTTISFTWVNPIQLQSEIAYRVSTSTSAFITAGITSNSYYSVGNLSPNTSYTFVFTAYYSYPFYQYGSPVEITVSTGTTPTPIQTKGLVLNLTPSNAVSPTWSDASYFNNNYTTTTTNLGTSTFPTIVTDSSGQQVVQFSSANNNCLSSAFSFKSSEFTVFIAIKFNSFNASTYTPIFGEGNVGGYQFVVNPNNYLSVSKIDTGTIKYSAPLTTGQWYIICLWGPGQTTDAGLEIPASCSVNGVLCTNTATINGCSATASPTYIGGAVVVSGSPHSNLNANIYNISVYDTVLPATTRDSLISSLGSALGVSTTMQMTIPFNPHIYSSFTKNSTAVLTPSSQISEVRIEEPCPFVVNNTLYILYTCWSPIGYISYSKGDTVFTQTKKGVALAPTPGSWDSGYVSGPSLYYESGVYYLYYFGSTNTSFEGAPANVGVATATSLDGPWTKYGSAPIITTTMASPWGSNIIFRSGVLKVSTNNYVLFVNGNGSLGREVEGKFTATSPLGPWTAYPSNPVIVQTPTPSGVDSFPDNSRIADLDFMQTGQFGNNYLAIGFDQSDPNSGQCVIYVSSDLLNFTAYPVIIRGTTNPRWGVRARWIYRYGSNKLPAAVLFDDVNNSGIYYASIDSCAATV